MQKPIWGVVKIVLAKTKTVKLEMINYLIEKNKSNCKKN
jgi:hypothetical protein